jgi:hypothetical protein
MIMEDMHSAAAVVPRNYSLNIEEFPLSDDDIVDCCGCLVVILPESGAVNLAHPSVSDYLESAKSQTNPGVIVASSCITYLASDDIKFHQNPWRCPFFKDAKMIWLVYTRGKLRKNCFIQ